MNVTIQIIPINTYAPIFVENSNGDNYCNSERPLLIQENSLNEFEIVAYDEDLNTNLKFFTPIFTRGEPQASFVLNISIAQSGRNKRALVKNVHTFDYEQPLYGTNSFQIMFYVSDSYPIQRSAFCFLNIHILDSNDNPPQFTEPSYTLSLISQFQLRQWSFMFLAVDQDQNSNITYAILPPNQVGQVDYRLIFDLNQNGLLSIRNVTFINDFNGLIRFFIQANDGVLSSTPTQVIISKITSSLPPIFKNFPNPPELTVSETIQPGSQIAKFDIRIQDANLTHLYLRCFLLKQSYEPFKFEFSSPRHVLNAHETCVLNLNENLNFMRARRTIVYLTAELGNQQTGLLGRQIRPIIINVKEENKFIPRFFQSILNISILEGDDDVGKIVAIAQAYDLDRERANRRIFYGLNSSEFFSINYTTGQIKLIKGIFNQKIVNLEVRASNSPDLFLHSTQYINILIIDINNHPPKAIDHEFNVTQSPSPGLKIGEIAYSDSDMNSILNFFTSIQEFSLKTGNLTLNTHPNVGRYEFKAIINDAFFSTEFKLIVNFINFNESPPQFTRNHTVEISEDTINVNLITLQAMDIGDYGLVYDVFSTVFINKSSFRLNSTSGRLQLISKLDRDEPNTQEYILPISVSDRFGNKSLNSLTTYSNLRIIVRDVNDNAPLLAFLIESSEQGLSIDPFKQSQNSFLIVDLDQINNQPFHFVQNNLNDLFEFSFIQNNGTNRELWSMRARQLNYSQSVYFVSYTLSDNQNIARNGTLKISIIGLPFQQIHRKTIQIDFEQNLVKNLAIIRINGLMVEEFLDSQYEFFTNEITTIFGSNGFELVSIQNYSLIGSKFISNEIFSNLTFYGSELNFLIRQKGRYLSPYEIYFTLKNQKNLTSNIQIIDNICNFETYHCSNDSFCKQTFVPSVKISSISSKSYLVNGLRGFIRPRCFCSVEPNPLTCLNGGATITLNNSEFYCQCPDGFDGPNCELLTISFSNQKSQANVHAKFPSSTLCDATRIEVQFLTSNQNGLILFNGAQNIESLLFISIELIDSYLVVQLGTNRVVFNEEKLADNQWHYVDVSIIENIMQVNVDNCYLKALNHTNLSELKNDANQKNAQMTLSLGSISPEILKSKLYSQYLSVYEYEGCLRNLVINGQLRDLKLNLSLNSVIQEGCSCEIQNTCTNDRLVRRDAPFYWWIILIIFGVFLLTGLLIAYIVWRLRNVKTNTQVLKEKPSIIYPTDEIRETIMNYEEEAGEQNTKDFNMQKIHGVDKTLLNNRIIFQAQKIEPNRNDEYLTYENEGVGSDAGTLSTISSEYNHGQKYRILHENDPKLTKIFELYGYDVEGFTNDGFV